eukprot:scaffold2421_cov390-Prasinococcus_capsulatus_cf.AAC.5
MSASGLNGRHPLSNLFLHMPYRAPTQARQLRRVQHFRLRTCAGRRCVVSVSLRLRRGQGCEVEQSNAFTNACCGKQRQGAIELDRGDDVAGMIDAVAA